MNEASYPASPLPCHRHVCLLFLSLPLLVSVCPSLSHPTHMHTYVHTQPLHIVLVCHTSLCTSGKVFLSGTDPGTPAAEPCVCHFRAFRGHQPFILECHIKGLATSSPSITQTESKLRPALLTKEHRIES